MQRFLEALCTSRQDLSAYIKERTQSHIGGKRRSVLSMRVRMSFIQCARGSGGINWESYTNEILQSQRDLQKVSSYILDVPFAYIDWESTTPQKCESWFVFGSQKSRRNFSGKFPSRCWWPQPQYKFDQDISTNKNPFRSWFIVWGDFKKVLLQRFAG